MIAMTIRDLVQARLAGERGEDSFKVIYTHCEIHPAIKSVGATTITKFNWRFEIMAPGNTFLH